MKNKLAGVIVGCFLSAACSRAFPQASPRVSGGFAVGQETVGVTKPVRSQNNEPVARELSPNVPGHTGFLDSKNGFRGVAFGADVREFKNLKIYAEEMYANGNSVKAYRKTDDNLLIGTAAVQNIIYIFVHDKFYAVSIHVDSQNGNQLLKLFQVAFGPGVRPQDNPSQYFWTGRVASAHFFENVGANHEIRAWIGNNELQKQYDQAMSEIYLAAAQQL
jgi:hypothetical protein